MKKFFSLTLTLAAMLSAMAVSAQAADYSFETDGTPEYYPSSSYEDVYGCLLYTSEKSLLAAKIQRLHTFFSLLIPDMSHEERQLLDDAMICTYGTKGITHDNASLEQPKHPGRYKEMPILGDLYEILAASPETKRLANILNRLVNGSARSFNQQTNVALDNKYKMCIRDRWTRGSQTPTTWERPWPLMMFN